MSIRVMKFIQRNRIPEGWDISKANVINMSSLRDLLCRRNINPRHSHAGLQRYQPSGFFYPPKPGFFLKHTGYFLFVQTRGFWLNYNGLLNFSREPTRLDQFTHLTIEQWNNLTMKNFYI